MTTMAKNEVKYRPATMADIENRDKNLFMNGEQVWVLMINRSQTIGEGEAKLDYITLTNMKKVQVEDLQVIDDGETEPDSEEEPSPLEAAFRERKEKSRGAMLLIRQTLDYYWMLFEDATEAAPALGLEVEKFGSRLTPRIRFHHTKLDTYLPRLIRAGNRVAICDKITIKVHSGTDPIVHSEQKSNNSNSEDKSMKTNENNIETKNVAMEAQVNNQTTDVDVPEVDDIAPKVTKRAVAQAMVQAANGGPATTMPLGQHGTLVIAGVGGKKSDGGSKTADVPQPSDIKPQTSTKVQDSVPATGKLTYATYEKQKMNKTTGKPYTVTHAKIMGFAATDEAYQRGMELHGAVSGEMVDGVKVLGLYFSHRYAAAAKLVCDALNAGKPFAECVAIIDNATEENARKREEWKAKMEERKQKREERKTAKNQPSAVSRQTSGEKSYTLDEVAAMLGKLLPDGAAKVDDIKKLLKAA